MESSRRDGYDGYFTWGGALLQLELVGLKAKIGLGGHKAPIFIYTTRGTRRSVIHHCDAPTRFSFVRELGAISRCHLTLRQLF